MKLLALSTVRTGNELPDPIIACFEAELSSFGFFQRPVSIVQVVLIIIFVFSLVFRLFCTRYPSSFVTSQIKKEVGDKKHITAFGIPSLPKWLNRRNESEKQQKQMAAVSNI